MTSVEQLTIRPLIADDRGALARFPERVSPQSAIARFHGAVSRLPDDLLDRLVDLEPRRREAVVAIDGHGIAGIAGSVRDAANESRAEVAVLVADEWQRQGVARLMLRPLAASALEAGITHFWADTRLRTPQQGTFLPSSRQRYRSSSWRAARSWLSICATDSASSDP